MREILFRGKRLCLDEWVEGYFVMAKMYRSDEELCEYISIPHPEVEGMPSDNFLVDPDTVGQFTGLTDKNGRKIFEGDIVQYYGTYSLEVFIENGHTKTRWFDTVTNRECTEFFMGYDEGLGECEIIGNIHDNHELLEGEQ